MNISGGQVNISGGQVKISWKTGEEKLEEDGSMQ